MSNAATVNRAKAISTAVRKRSPLGQGTRVAEPPASSMKRGGVIHRAGGGDTDQLPTAAAAPPDPDVHNMMVHGYRSQDGNNFVDDTGNFLEGAPDANGMMAMPVHADGTYAGVPKTYGIGPGYNPSDARYTGTPLTPPEGALDWSGGTMAPSNWQDFAGKDTSTGGNFFTLDDFYRSQPNPNRPTLSGGRASSDIIGGGGQDVPHAFQSGSNMPSTNNYRLLPPMYRTPNYIMRNGRIIDLNADTEGPPGWRETGGRYRSGAGSGFPSATPVGLGANWGSLGWPGQISAWTTPEPGTRDNRGGTVRRPPPRGGLGR